ncbi:MULTISPECIES: isoprenyl transferase [unclassified Fusobacterium]|uniref:isoprenyl transferase n=2 Tax=unclassified Fusobacterium TaxID=2648384 RepID=UPI0032C44E6A
MKIMKIQVPDHIAIIMDGNGRWAKKRGLPRTFGHREGAASLRKVITHAAKLGVKYLTVYAFSTENWKRSKEEVSALMFLFKSYIKNEEKNIMENNIRFMVSGRTDNVSPALLKAIRALEEKSKNNTGLTFNIAFNYGGRAEIVDAVNRIIKSGVESVDEESFSKYLYHDIPDPELLIRTSGELRISNFLLWQIAYSEIYITDTLWPDFDEKELEKAIEEFNKRDRRFGGAK